MFTQHQNTTVCAVWSTKYGSAGLDAANKIITNEIKKGLKFSWERFVSVHMPFHHISSVCASVFLHHQDTTQQQSHGNL